MKPRFFLQKELTVILLKIINAYPPEWKEKLLFNRRRPRAKGETNSFSKRYRK
jgi:hypothetical protein